MAEVSIIRDGVRGSVPAENLEKAKLLGWAVDEAADAAAPAGEKKSSAMDSVEAFGTGAAKFLTGGLTDATAGAFAGLATGIEALTQGKGLGGAAEDAMAGYREGRGERRAYEEEQYQESPLAYGAGGLTGALVGGKALPTQGKTLAGTMGRSGAAGAATGLSMSEEDTVSGDLMNLLLGGALGGAAPAVGAGLGKAKDAVKGALAKAGSRADELRVLTTAGATGGSIAEPAVLKEARRVPGGIPETARVLRESGISKGITTTGGIAKRAEAARAASGAKIGQMIDDATNAGGFVDTAKLAGNLRAQAKAAVADMGGVSDTARQHARTLEALAERIEAAAPGGVAKPDAIKAMSVGLSEDAQQAYKAGAMGRPVSGRGKALMDTRRATEGALDETMANLGMDDEAYRQARRINQVSRIADESAQTSLGRSNKNNLLGLADMQAIGAGAAAAGGPGAVALTALRQIGKSVGASGRATAAEWAAKIAQNPALAGEGPMAAKILEAARSGAPALQALARQLMTPEGEAEASMDEVDRTIQQR